MKSKIVEAISDKAVPQLPPSQGTLLTKVNNNKIAETPIPHNPPFNHAFILVRPLNYLHFPTPLST